MVKIIGDRLLFKNSHYSKANVLFPLILENYKPKQVVAIGAESGVGKSEIASILQEKLWEEKQIRAKIIHIDDYYGTNWEDRNNIRKKNGIDSVGAKEIDWTKLEKIFKRFKSEKRKLYVQRIHKFTNCLEYVITNSKNIDVILFEGLYACYSNKTDLKIYLEGSMKDTYQFRKERAKENPDDNFREQILVKEAIDVRKTKKKADIILDWNAEIKKSNLE